MTKTALVLGGTGLIGNHLLNQIVKDQSWDRIVVLTRRPLGMASDKIVEVIADATQLDDVADQLVADTVFCALGTTQKVAGGRENFRKIDHDYILRCAEIAHANGAKRFILVSSVGAKVGSPSYYTHVKGETERDLEKIGFETLDFLQPSLLTGARKDFRWNEAIGGKILPAFNFLMVGPLKKIRPIEGAQVARAMAAIARNSNKGLTRHTNDLLFDY